MTSHEIMIIKFVLASEYVPLHNELKEVCNYSSDSANNIFHKKKAKKLFGRNCYDM